MMQDAAALSNVSLEQRIGRKFVDSKFNPLSLKSRFNFGKSTLNNEH